MKAKKRKRKRKKKKRKRKRRRRGEEEIKQKGMETNLDYGFYEIWHGSLVLYDSYLAQT